MVTISGVEVNLTNDAAPTLYDVGYQLCQVPRFGGALIDRWSVLHHLFACAFYAESMNQSIDVQLYALLHDAHEAITSDIPRPWKTLSMREAQALLDCRFYKSLHLPIPSEGIQSTIHEIDVQMCYAEAERYAPQVFSRMTEPEGYNRLTAIKARVRAAHKIASFERGLFGPESAGWRACGRGYENAVNIIQFTMGEVT